jgi:asparagine synthetase B (glutamine-hydrolysing)
MCGIDTAIASTGEQSYPQAEERESFPATNSYVIPDGIKRRGPDGLSTCSFQYASGTNWLVRASSSVLHLRGPNTVVQPLENDRFILQWNGEVYDGIPVSYFFRNSDDKLINP